jgi:dTDP-4-amino-4,6-dideoxygalactose transaminase
VDIDPVTYTMDPALLEKAVTKKTKAIIPVHLFGQCADMDPIMAIAAKRGIPVVEDACQAHGAKYKGRTAGSIGAAGCFSFYPGKNLGALGEAGAIVTNNSDLAAKMQVLRDHGQSKKYHHAKIGWNGRMDGVQGAVLSVKLKHLDLANHRRQAHALSYSQWLGGAEQVITPVQAAHNQSVFHVYAVRVKNRDRVLQEMGGKGISCAIHYPIPVHLQEAYRGLGLGNGSFPVAEQCADEFLSLPMFPELTQEQVRAVADALKQCVGAAPAEKPCRP